MKKVAIVCLSFMLIPNFVLAGSDAPVSSDNYFIKDPEAIYDNRYKDIDLVIEIPGYKLNPQSELYADKKDFEYANHIGPDILDKAKKYIEYRKINHSKTYHLSAAKELGEYILLYFAEPEVIDGGFELVWSKKLKRIIGEFLAVTRG